MTNANKVGFFWPADMRATRCGRPGRPVAKALRTVTCDLSRLIARSDGPAEIGKGSVYVAGDCGGAGGKSGGRDARAQH